MKKIFEKIDDKPKHMDFMAPFCDSYHHGKLSKKREDFKFLDWDKVREVIKENPNSIIQVGLLEDFTYTGDIIYNKKPIKKFYVHDNSNWATPVVIIDGKVYACYSSEKTEPI